MMQYSTPFLFLFIVDAFRAMDPALEESSRMSGATRWQTFWRVTLALMLPVTTSAFILSFIRGIESFESAVFFGTPVGIEVITTDDLQFDHPARASPTTSRRRRSSFAALALMFLLLVLQSRLLRGRSFTTVTGKGYSPNIMRLGRLRWVTFAHLHPVLRAHRGAAGRPAPARLVLQVLRLLRGRHADLDHYRSVWENSSFWRAFGNTMLLGVVGATATMVLGGIVAYVTTRTRWRGRRLIDVLAWLPWMMPGMVLGHRLPVGLRHPAARHPDLRHAVGAAAGLYRARHAGRGARDVGRLPADRLRHRGVLARARRRLVADAAAAS